jgi:hypothetical protein
MTKVKKSKNKKSDDKIVQKLREALEAKTDLGKEIDEKVDASVKELFKLLTEAAAKEENDLSRTARELAAYWHTTLARWQETPTMEEDIPKEDTSLA